MQGNTKLDDSEREYFEKFPTIDECEQAVLNMKENKSPGSDGLPVEFYKTFWHNLKSHFYSALEETFEKESMSYSQRLSIIALLYKKGDKESLQNYRPISLCNTDYKILAFVFARRLQTVVDKLIGRDQSAYIKGRYIGISARTVLDIFEYCEETNSEGILLFLDFQKAFDSVEWNFLFKSLEYFNFGQNFLK